MSNITDKLIVLKLNKSWQPVGYSTVGKAITDLCAGLNCYALDIDYAVDSNGSPNYDQPTKMVPVDWEDWIKLPVRSWDLVARSPSITIRVPTILVAKNFNEMPLRFFRGRPSRKQIYKRDGGIDQYTGKKLAEDEISIDHVIPKSRGGKNTWENQVLTHKKINYAKGNSLNEEVGLKLIRQPQAPKPIAVSATINEIKHEDWRHFIQK